MPVYFFVFHRAGSHCAFLLNIVYSLALCLSLCSLASAQAGAPVADDFNGTALNNSLWTTLAPAGGTVSVGNGHVVLSVPGGSNHDAFVGGNNSVRIIQPIANGDFDVAAKFDTGLNASYQGQGILVQQDSATYLRFEFGSNGQTSASASLVSAGQQSTFFQTVLSNSNPSKWLQVKRFGNTWTLSCSNDGVTYTTVGSFSKSLTVSAAGLYAWNYNSTPSAAPALSSSIDFFHNLNSNPPMVATPSISPASGTTLASSLTVSITDSTAGATIYYTTDGSMPTAGSPVYGGPIIITGSTTVKAMATVSGETSSSVATATYIAQSGQAGAPVSDDFNGTALNSALWTTYAPAGGTVSVGNGHVILSVPGGSNHDAFVGGNNSVRIIQPIANGDFDVAAKFDTALSGSYQGQGILIQQDNATYLRIEFASNGQTSASAFLVSAGQESAFFQTTLSNSSPSKWLQVKRSGNTWTVSYSNDGATYTTLSSFSQPLTVSAAGLYAWNYSSTPSAAPALSSSIDYFYNLSTSGGGGTQPPAISGVGANPSSTSASVTWTTDQAASSQVKYGATTSYGSQAGNSALVLSHTLFLNNLTCNSQYHYLVASTNSAGETATSGDQVFNTQSCSTGQGPTSDNFDSRTLNSQIWTFVNPAADAVLTMDGTAATLNLPGATIHDPWTSGNKAVSLMQPVNNGNFQVQVKFRSDVEIGNQDEGIMVQQDATHFLRFDVLFDGTSVRLFSAAIQGSSATVFGNLAINVTQAPIWLQLTRTGNNWSGSWSTDGSTFNPGFSFTYAMTASSIGPYAGNASATLANSPAFSVIVDYFFNTASPLSNLDGPPPFRAITVEANPPSTLVEKALADIQGTGHLNPVAGFESPSGGIYWYEYPASGKLTDPWLKHAIVSNGNAYEDMVALDVNNDGAVDIVASYNPPSGSNLIVWFENPRGYGGNPATDPWNMYVIGTGAGENNLIVSDLDGDGKPDIATGYYLYFQNTATSWTQVQYNNAFRGVATLDIGSGKGSINLVSIAAGTYDTAWFENPREHGGNARTGTWTLHNIGAGYPCNANTCPNGDYYVSTFGAGDLNGDGKEDVVMGQSEAATTGPPAPGGLIWFEAPADRRNGTWIRHTIDGNFIDTHSIRVLDMDHNGTLDIVTSEQDQSTFRRVAVFYNDGSGNFTEDLLSNAAGHNSVVGDVDADGSIDIFNSGHGYTGLIHPLQLFLNPIR